MRLGLRREDTLCRSRSIVSINQIATTLTQVIPPLVGGVTSCEALVGVTGCEALVSLSLCVYNTIVYSTLAMLSLPHYCLLFQVPGSDYQKQRSL